MENQAFNKQEPLTTSAVESNETAEVLDASTDASLSGVLIGKNDVLFGRGGLTNRHFGNKKYRDVINEFREEYVAAKKVEKPRVAKRVVKKILSEDFASSPVRFLKRDDTGHWVEVDEHEAACKVSQALREKSRWSCMKSDDAGDAVDVNRLELDSVETPTKKRNQPDVEADAPSVVLKIERNQPDGKAVLKIETIQPTTGETKVKKIKVEAPWRRNELISDSTDQNISANTHENKGTEIKATTLPGPLPTALQINVPPLEVPSPSTILPSTGSMPTDADVLFGRGGRTNHHPGNKRLRMIVDHYKVPYEMARKADKPKYAKAIVQSLREHATPSRFLRINENTNQWEDVGDRRAAEKVSQTLREKEKEKEKGGKAKMMSL